MAATTLSRLGKTNPTCLRRFNRQIALPSWQQLGFRPWVADNRALPNMPFGLRALQGTYGWSFHVRRRRWQYSSKCEGLWRISEEYYREGRKRPGYRDSLLHLCLWNTKGRQYLAKVMGMSWKYLSVHMVIVCAASPIIVTLPPRLSHMPLLGAQSSTETFFASVPGGMEFTISLNGSAHSCAKLFIKSIRPSLLKGTSNGASRPWNPLL